MSDTENSETPVFLDEDNECPKRLPLMVTRHSLRSLGLHSLLLKEASAQQATDGPLVETAHNTQLQSASSVNTVTECSTQEHKA